MAKVAPKGVDKVQLYSSGAEAVESAFRLAKNYTGHHELVGFWGGFHGKTAGALAVNGSGNAKTYGPLPPGHVLPFANCYRCPLKLKYPSCGIACADLAREQLRQQSTGSVAAVIMEPLAGHRRQRGSAAGVHGPRAGAGQGARRASSSPTR